MLAFAAFLVWGLYASLKGAMDSPTVQKSMLTGHCVQVITSNGGPASCDHLPRRYRLEWVD